MKNNVKEWIISWFEKHISGKAIKVRQHTDDNYFDKEWIDSLSFIAFVNDLEEEFKVRFSNDDFQDKRFSTVDGLAKLIEERMRKK